MELNLYQCKAVHPSRERSEKRYWNTAMYPARKCFDTYGWEKVWPTLNGHGSSTNIRSFSLCTTVYMSSERYSVKGINRSWLDSLRNIAVPVLSCWKDLPIALKKTLTQYLMRLHPGFRTVLSKGLTANWKWSSVPCMVAAEGCCFLLSWCWEEVVLIFADEPIRDGIYTPETSGHEKRAKPPEWELFCPCVNI